MVSKATSKCVCPVFGCNSNDCKVLRTEAYARALIRIQEIFAFSYGGRESAAWVNRIDQIVAEELKR